jgi:hypothetical protein
MEGLLGHRICLLKAMDHPLQVEGGQLSVATPLEDRAGRGTSRAVVGRGEGHASV